MLGGLAFLLARQQQGPSPRGHGALEPIACSPGTPKRHSNTQSLVALKLKHIRLFQLVLPEGNVTAAALIAISSTGHADLKNIVAHYTNLLKANFVHAFWQSLSVPQATLVGVSQATMIAVAAAL